MSIELSAPIRRRAGLAIENTHREYNKDNGLHALEKKVEEAAVKCSTYIYGLAVFAHDPSHSEDPEALFNAMCAYAEEQYKTRHSVTNVKEVLPCWAMYKSNINRGIRLGLKPTSFKTEWELRKATADAVEGTGGGEAPRQVAKSAASASTREEEAVPAAVPPRTLEQAEDWVAETTIDSKLKLSIAQLLVEAEYVRPDAMKEAREIVRDAVVRLHALVDKRKIRDSATREALKAVAQAAMH